jgi:ATP synthase protein I
MSSMKELGRYGTVGLDLIVSIAIGYFAGRWIDARFGGKGWITMLGVVFGVITGFRFLWRAAKRMEHDLEKDDKKRGAPPWS